MNVVVPRANVDYIDDVRGLGEAFDIARDVDIESSLSLARQTLASRNLVAIGVGGTSPLALFAANLHKWAFARFAVATTPLAYLESPRDSAAVIIFSAQARHPDTEAAVREARVREQPVILLTQRHPDELSSTFADAQVIQVPMLAGRDGFLATQSVVTMATIASRLFQSDDLPRTLPLESDFAAPVLTDHLLVLHGSLEEPAARDIEVRFEELGLAAVQLADYRAFAHGRHVGLARRAASTTVVALHSPLTRELAHKTLDRLPADIRVIEIATSLEGSNAVLDLLVATAKLPIEPAQRSSVNPNRPAVPPFGRFLYHLPYRRTVASRPTDAITRKLEALGGAASPAAQGIVEDAFDNWRSALGRVRFRGIVCDYDGTVVATSARYELPSDETQAALLRILNAGVPVSFATGRGDSLHESLRAWVPKRLWPLVTLGLHNGAWTIQLADDAIEPTSVPAALAASTEVLLNLAAKLPSIRVRRSPTQLSFEPTTGAFSLDLLRSLVAETLSATGSSLLRVASSGHSVDVTAGADDKTSVLRATGVASDELLVIGDHGEAFGNDFELLNATKTSMSVDRCSAALDRCWNLGRAGEPGHISFARILKLARPSSGGFRMTIPRQN